LVNVMSADHVPAATPLLAISTRNRSVAQAGAEGIDAVRLGADGATVELGDELASVGLTDAVVAVRPAASAVDLVAHAAKASTGSAVSKRSLPGVRTDMRGTIPRQSRTRSEYHDADPPTNGCRRIGWARRVSAA
jgi:hypothetical protein